MKNIAIFASGTGSNAREIIKYFESHSTISVQLVVSNKPTAAVLTIAEDHGISTLILQRQIFYESEVLLEGLAQFSIDFIVLAGFLWLVPEYLIKTYRNKIVNVHPALLPKYGGKGMYGMHVHRSVHQAQEQHTGITIHFVNEQYDEGQIIFQARCAIAAVDTPEDISLKVRRLEHYHFSRVIEDVLS